MDQPKVTITENQKETFWCVPSKHYLDGVFQYTYYHLTEQNELTTPASANVTIIFVMAGGCCYQSTNVKKGDVFLCGINKNPFTSFATDIEMFSVNVSYILLYKKFGLLPASYSKKALCLPKDHILCNFSKKLMAAPMEQWVELSERFLEASLDKQTTDEKPDPFECVLRVARNLREKGCPDALECCKEFGISKRHLQRRFIQFFGITIRDYEIILRFSKAYSNLEESSLTDTALDVGYYDQSHMNREFKKMAGISPQLATQHTIYSPLKETFKNLESYENPDDKLKEV